MSPKTVKQSLDKAERLIRVHVLTEKTTPAEEALAESIKCLIEAIKDLQSQVNWEKMENG